MSANDSNDDSVMRGKMARPNTITSIPTMSSEFSAIKESFPILLAKLGDPPEIAKSSQNDDANESGKTRTARSYSVSSALDEYLLQMEKKPHILKAIDAAKKKMIFYCVNPSSASTANTPSSSSNNSASGIPAFVFVCKRVDRDVDYSVMLYIVLKELNPFLKVISQLVLHFFYCNLRIV
jgi:hypothetical protein